MPVLRAEGLFKRFGRRAVVNGISLEVRTGEIVALLGRNGAGKTTTFRMMAGLLPPDAGRVSLGAEDLSRLTTSERARRGIVYLPQESSVFLKTTVLRNLLMVLELAGTSRRGAGEIASRILHDLGLEALAGQAAHRLSGGEKRRLEVGRALALDPKFLLLDEPFTGIDPLTVQGLQELVRRLAARDIGLLISDHNVRDTFRSSGRVYVIDDGAVLAEGPPGAVAADVEVRRRFLGESFPIR
jgi:lipopolysaccharide export system ATP-binding protein